MNTVISKKIYIDSNCDNACINSGSKKFLLDALPDTDSNPKREKWYFVTKIVLTYCEKKMF